ncbi:MAG: hypothetical protein U0V70_21130 [Terriglobia bacterium]
MDNYFNYFTEIEEHFQKCRGTPSLLSPLDWALIESFQEAGIPLPVVLRGIDLAFEKHQRKGKTYQKVNSLSYCTQMILEEYERLKEGSTGKSREDHGSQANDADDVDNLLRMLKGAKDLLRKIVDESRAASRVSLAGVFESAIDSLDAAEKEFLKTEDRDVESLEMRLNVLEDKILSSLIGNLGEQELFLLRQEVNSELQRHRRGLKPEQLAMLEKKLFNRKLFERFKVPRLSLFYLSLN